MKHLINKLLVFLMCVTLLPGCQDVSAVAAACLSIISAACIGSYTERKWVFLCIGAVYSVISIFVPPFALFLPVLLYDVSGVSVGSRTSLLCVFIALFISFRNFRFTICAGLVIFCAAAYALQYYSRRMDEVITRFHHYRDDSTESSLFLKEKNQSLIEKQDFEIHLATLTERNRIAREIHDNVGHMVTRSILQTGAIRVLNEDEALAKPIDELHETLNTAMTSIRNSVHDLHDEALNLEYALRDIARSVTGLTVTLEYELNGDMPKTVKYAFIAIVREAVSNTEKHSNADSLQITVREQPALYQLLIRDNGTDIRHTQQPGQTEDSGIGLANMQERVRALGGNIHISADRGFQIFISILKNRR